MLFERFQWILTHLIYLNLLFHLKKKTKKNNKSQLKLLKLEKKELNRADSRESTPFFSEIHSCLALLAKNIKK